ncbi:hypothetical protein ABPG74_015338 [Tetrahymena malaccensis]
MPLSQLDNSPKYYETIYVNFTDQDIVEIQSSDEFSSLQPTPQMINQRVNQKQKNQVHSLQKSQDNKIIFDNSKLLYEEIDLYNNKEEKLLDYNSIASINLLNQTSVCMKQIIYSQFKVLLQLNQSYKKEKVSNNIILYRQKILQGKLCKYWTIDNQLHINKINLWTIEQLTHVIKQTKKIQFKEQPASNQSSKKAIKIVFKYSCLCQKTCLSQNERI